MDEMSYEERVANAKTRIREVSPAEVIAMRERGEDFTVIDCREPNEWNLFHLPGALHVALGALPATIEQLVPREREVVVYCARGNRSALAADAMRELGYSRVSSMAEGIRGWVNAGGDVEQ